MPNVFVDTWRIGRDLREGLAGYRMAVDVGATLDIDADLQDCTDDEIIVAGGVAEKGGQTVIVALVDLPGGVMPEKNTPVVTSEGLVASWLTAKRNAGLVTAIIGDPAGFQQGEHSRFR